MYNLQYELLLLDIAWGISHPHDAPERKAMIGLAVHAMNMVIQPLSNDMTERAMDTTHPMKAGPPYGLSNESLPSSVAEFRARFNALLARQAELIHQIQGTPAFETDIVGSLRLNEIAMLNVSRLPLLPPGL
jgi:hypothetical protein